MSELMRRLCVFTVAATFLFAAEEPVPGSLSWQAARARLRGESSVSIGPPTKYVVGAESLESAAKKASVVVAELIDQAVTHDNYQIYTCMKFKIDKQIGPLRSIVPGAVPAEMPERLLPVHPGEFIMVEPYGSLKLDGVTFSQGDPNWHPPIPSERRLMFLQFFANGKIAGSVFGNAGIFSMTDDDSFVPVSHRDTVLRRELEEKAKNRLSVLRTFVH